MKYFISCLLVVCCACGGSQKSPKDDTVKHTPPEDTEPIETVVPEDTVETPTVEPEFEGALIRLVDDAGKTRLHVNEEGDVIAKEQTIGRVADGKFSDAKGRVLMEIKDGKLVSQGKDLGTFSDDGLSVSTPAGMVGIDENGNMVSKINKTNETFRSIWRFPNVPEDHVRHAVILAIAFQDQMQLKPQE